MQRLVGIFRIEADLDEALDRPGRAARPLDERSRATGGRVYNPGWNLVFELDHLLIVSEAIARSARQRTESRGAHSRLDYPGDRRRRTGARSTASSHGTPTARWRSRPRHSRRWPTSCAACSAQRRPLTTEGPMPDAHLRVFRGSPGEEGRFDEFDVPVEEGMVVLDALHWIQGHEAPDLAVRWNCKAAKCGSCSAEVDGRPSLMCKTRLSDFDLEQPITVEPMRAFPLIRDLVTDVSWNYEVNKTIQPFTPPADVPQEDWRWQQEDVERVQEYRKCIECFLCQDVCHVLRNHETERPFMGPRFLVRTAGLEMHPIDQADRREYLKESGGIGYCNITKCCTEVCPEHIRITDNAIIPLKERVADAYYDPIQWVWRKLRGGGSGGVRRPSCRSCQGAAADRRRRTRPRLPIERHRSSRISSPKPTRYEPRPPPRTRGFVIRTDGAARGNPGPASLGAALFDLGRPDARDDRAVPDASISDYLGIQTNNVAEYTGVVRALALARELGAREVHLLLDSKLIVEQLAGRWRVKDAKLIPLWSAARTTLGRLRPLVGDARATGPQHRRRRPANEAHRPGRRRAARRRSCDDARLGRSSRIAAARTGRACPRRRWPDEADSG